MSKEQRLDAQTLKNAQLTHYVLPSVGLQLMLILGWALIIHIAMRFVNDNAPMFWGFSFLCFVIYHWLYEQSVGKLPDLSDDQKKGEQPKARSRHQDVTPSKKRPSAFIPVLIGLLSAFLLAKNLDLRWHNAAEISAWREASDALSKNGWVGDKPRPRYFKSAPNQAFPDLFESFYYLDTQLSSRGFRRNYIHVFLGGNVAKDSSTFVMAREFTQIPDDYTHAALLESAESMRARALKAFERHQASGGYLQVQPTFQQDKIVESVSGIQQTR